jgi:hypothetical protein
MTHARCMLGDQDYTRARRCARPHFLALPTHTDARTLAHKDKYAMLIAFPLQL